MWEHEKALVRDDSGIDFNLAIGDPVFLRTLLKRLDWQNPMRLSESSGYPKVEVIEQLEEAIRANLPVKKFLVPTIGAKHGLHAALYALNSGPVSKSVRFRRPFWVSYPSIAQYAGMDWKDSGGVLDPEDEIYIHASPNNPDGLIRGGPFVEGKVPNGCSVVWDAAYAHRLYGWRHSHFPGYHDISVWSGGKLTGNTGARVGWLSTDDEFLADRARQYVEQTTSGVSVDAQVAVTVDLEKLAYEPSIADEFRESVSVNRLIITNALLRVDDDLTDHTDEGGMFMWVHSPQSFKLNKALKTAKIAVLRGEACGMKAPGWYRWSLGQSNEFTRNAMNALTKGL